MKYRSKITHFRHSLSFASFSSFVFLLVLFICLWGTAGYAEIFMVTTTNDDGPGSLRAAILSADFYEDVISFDVTGIIILEEQLSIDHGLTIQGPGAEYLAVSGYDTSRVFFINTTESVDISGLTIMNGYALSSAGGGIYNMADNLTLTNCTFGGNIADIDGGGIYNEDCDPTITNCVFTVNSADHDGGGMYNERSNPDITNCTFDGNSAGNAGGGIYNISSSPEIINCTLFSNDVTNHGGGMYNSGSDPVLTSCDFTYNSATNGGGMANCTESNPILTDCTFYDNVASSSGGAIWNYNFTGDNSTPVFSGCTFNGNIASQGGGIRSYSSSPEVKDSTFHLNSAGYGGGMYNNVSSPDISNCTFDGNSADFGAGMYNHGSEYTYVNNCTFSENQASSAGGMYNSESHGLMVIDCTFSVNAATINGSAIFNFSSSPTIINSIFWDDQGEEIFNASVSSQPYVVFCVVRNNETGDGSTTENIITADPVLEPLGDNGGPTWTCALGAGSSAIDEGAYEEGMPTIDQRGVSRPQGAGYDIGAFEVVQSSKVGDGGGGGGGCNISAMPSIGFLLLIPIALLLKLRK